MNCQGYRIAIPLLGKGATNHLHRREVVEEFASRSVEVVFLVREDYITLLQTIPGCSYLPIKFRMVQGWRAMMQHVSREIRKRHPSNDPGINKRYKLMHLSSSMGGRLVNFCYLFFARFRCLVKLLAKIEKELQKSFIPIIDANFAIDQVLLLGLGFKDSEIEGSLTWWALRNKISTVHIVGNYDNLSANGFRGAPVSKLLVWGKNMRRDAEILQDISPECISEIGSIRYNSMYRYKSSDNILYKEQFLPKIGLDPYKKTLLFAGFFFESQYFEMLACFRELKERDENLQLILRIYPNKLLMSSIYIEPLLHYAKNYPGVSVSLADPFYNKGEKGRAVLQIEEYELWNSLNSCDCLINFYSTIAIEGCMFDKPVLYMGYVPGSPGTLAREPVYYEYASNPHNRRLASYKAIKTAHNREELQCLILEALSNPGMLVTERHSVVEDEIGVTDGKACQRLVDICVQEYFKS